MQLCELCEDTPAVVRITFSRIDDCTLLDTKNVCAHCVVAVATKADAVLGNLN